MFWIPTGQKRKTSYTKMSTSPKGHQIGNIQHQRHQSQSHNPIRLIRIFSLPNKIHHQTKRKQL